MRSWFLLSIFPPRFDFVICGSEKGEGTQRAKRLRPDSDLILLSFCEKSYQLVKAWLCSEALLIIEDGLRTFAQFKLLAHFLEARSESLDLLLLLGEPELKVLL